MPAVNDSIPACNSPAANMPPDTLFMDSLCVDPRISLQTDNPVFEGRMVTTEKMYGSKSKLQATITNPYNSGEGIPREYPLGSSWAFLPVIGVLLLALLLLRYTRGYLNQLFTLVVSQKSARKQYKSDLQSVNRILLLLTLFAVIPATILAGYVVSYFPNQLSIAADYKLYLIIAAFIFAYSILKSIILFVAGILTYEEKLIQELRYSSRIFIGAWGVTVLPFIVLLAVNDNEADKLVFFYIVVGLSILLFTLYLIRSLQLFISEKISIFFWILYLCMLELLPVLLVFDYLFPFR